MKHSILRISVVTAFVTLLIVPALGVDTYWQHDPATSGGWFDPNNWNSGLPTRDDDAYINNGGTAHIAEWGATSHYLYLGYDSGDSGTVELLNGGSLNLCCAWVTVGKKGTGIFRQTGGRNASRIYLARDPGSHGTYELSGGSLSAGDVRVGISGTALFQQSGGTIDLYNRLSVGEYTGAIGTYELSGGEFHTELGVTIGDYGGTGTFTQTGGINTIIDSDDPQRNAKFTSLRLGYQSGSNGEYQLSNGQLSASNEYIGYDGTGLFTQGGGTNEVNNLSIESNGRYEFFAGTLQLSGGWRVAGEFDFAGRSIVWGLDSILVDLSEGIIQNGQNVSLSLGSDSLVIIAPASDPSAVFGSYNNAGMTHIAGSTLLVGATEGFSGWGNINDFVDCQGSISASAGGF